jgi:hypothetical protein
MSGALVDRVGHRGRLRGGGQRHRLHQDAPTLDELIPGWSVGRELTWPADASSFTITGFNTGTDGGQPALTLTDPFSPGLILTNATDFQNVRVTANYRAVPAPGLGINNILVKLLFRYQAGPKRWRMERSNSDGGGASALQFFADKPETGGANQSGFLGGEGFLNDSDSTTYQTILGECILDYARGKQWFDTIAEPDGLVLGTGTTTSGSASVSSVSASEGTFMVGMYITGPNIAAGTRITAVGSGTLTLNKNASGTGAASLRATGMLGLPYRSRPMFGFGGSTTTDLDNIPMTGQAGLTTDYGGAFRMIKVQEMVQTG